MLRLEATLLLLSATLLFAAPAPPPDQAENAEATDIAETPPPQPQRTRVGILPLAIEGNPPSDARERLSGRVRLALGAEDDVELVELASLEDPAAADVDAVVQAEVNIEGRDYFVRVVLLAPDGRLRHESEASCEICTHAEGAEALGFEVAALRARLTEMEGAEGTSESAAPVVVVNTRPNGATVSLDGKDRGTTPFEAETTPGPHRIELSKRGFRPEKAQIDAVAGGRHSVTLNLQERRARPMKIGGWAAVGVSVPLLVSGIALMALDERPFRRDCTGSDVDSLGNCRFRYSTLEGGVALTVLGVAAAATGVALLVIDRKRNNTKVSAGLTPTGVFVRGSF